MCVCVCVCVCVTQKEHEFRVTKFWRQNVFQSSHIELWDQGGRHD